MYIILEWLLQKGELLLGAPYFIYYILKALSIKDIFHNCIAVKEIKQVFCFICRQMYLSIVMQKSENTGHPKKIVNRC